MQLDRPFLLVTPTADGDVLTALARADAWFSVSQVQRVVGRYSLTGIRKVLNRLEEQGIVTAELTANSVSYRFNREHLAADAVIAVATARERLLDRLTMSLQTWETDIGFAAVFGSAARGGMRPDSDIDLLVIHSDDASTLHLDERSVDLLLSVKRWTGNTLSILTMSVTEFQGRLDESLFNDVRRDALTVAGSRNWFEAQFRAGGVRRAHA